MSYNHLFKVIILSIGYFASNAWEQVVPIDNSIVIVLSYLCVKGAIRASSWSAMSKKCSPSPSLLKSNPIPFPSILSGGCLKQIEKARVCFRLLLLVDKLLNSIRVSEFSWNARRFSRRKKIVGILHVLIQWSGSLAFCLWLSLFLGSIWGLCL